MQNCFQMLCCQPASRPRAAVCCTPEGLLRQGTALHVLQLLLQHTQVSALAELAAAAAKSTGLCSVLSSCKQRARVCLLGCAQLWQLLTVALQP
jgi:hypothetical protein